MRYDTPVYFQYRKAGEYDAETGNHAPDIVTETLRYAAVMDTKTSTMHLVYGAIREGSLTIQLQTHYDLPFHRIRIGDVQYTVDARRRLRVKHVFIVSEVQ